jgi:hypothetical protein
MQNLIETAVTMSTTVTLSAVALKAICDVWSTVSQRIFKTVTLLLHENIELLAGSPQSAAKSTQDVAKSPQNVAKSPQNVAKSPQNFAKSPQNVAKPPQSVDVASQSVAKASTILAGMVKTFQVMGFQVRANNK